MSIIKMIWLMCIPAFLDKWIKEGHDVKEYPLPFNPFRPLPAFSRPHLSPFLHISIPKISPLFLPFYTYKYTSI